MRHPIGTGALIVAGLLAPPLARAFSCANTPIGMVDCPDDQCEHTGSEVRCDLRVNGELGDAELWLVEDVTTEYFIGWGTDGGGVDFCCEAPTRNQGCTVEGTANHDFISLQSGSVTVHQSCTVYGYGADDALIGSTDPSVVDVMYAALAMTPCGGSPAWTP
jgi:hypothetical protein